MKNSIMLFCVAVFFCVSCTNVKETPKGLQFNVVRAGDGVLAKPREFLIMSLMFKDGKDSVWNDTRNGDPAIVMIQDSTNIPAEDGIDEIFRMLSKGDSITFKVSAKTLFDKTFHQPLPARIDPKSEFTFEMAVSDVYNREQVMKLQQQIVAKQNEKFLADQKEQIKKDIIAIDDYLRLKGIHADVDSSGLRYNITRPGKGLRPTAVDSVVVNYVGKLMDTGFIFDQSKAPVTFSLSRVINGWKLGFPLITEGARATFYIPSALAYGPRGYPPMIPANANLIFEVELLKIKK